jgi:hypothetical protein
MTDDRGLDALAAALDRVDVASGYRLSSITPPIGPTTLAAAILGERGVYLAEGWPESVRDAAARLGIPARYDDLPVDIVHPAPFPDDSEPVPPAKGTRHGPQCAEQAATIAALRAAPIDADRLGRAMHIRLGHSNKYGGGRCRCWGEALSLAGVYGNLIALDAARAVTDGEANNA